MSSVPRHKAIAVLVLLWIALLSFYFSPKFSGEVILTNVLGSDISTKEAGEQKASPEDRTFDLLVQDTILPQTFSLLQSLGEKVYVYQGVLTGSPTNESDVFKALEARRYSIPGQNRFIVRVPFTKFLDASSVSLDSMLLYRSKDVSVSSSPPSVTPVSVEVPVISDSPTPESILTPASPSDLTPPVSPPSPASAPETSSTLTPAIESPVSTPAPAPVTPSESSVPESAPAPAPSSPEVVAPTSSPTPTLKLLQASLFAVEGESQGEINESAPAVQPVSENSTPSVVPVSSPAPVTPSEPSVPESAPPSEAVKTLPESKKTEELVPSPEPQPIPEKKLEPEVKLKAEPESKPEPELESKPEPEPQVKPQSDSIPPPQQTLATSPDPTTSSALDVKNDQPQKTIVPAYVVVTGGQLIAEFQVPSIDLYDGIILQNLKAKEQDQIVASMQMPLADWGFLYPQKKVKKSDNAPSIIKETHVGSLPAITHILDIKHKQDEGPKSRTFTHDEKAKEASANQARRDRTSNRKKFVKAYYGKEKSDTDFKKVTDQVYYFDADLFGNGKHFAPLVKNATFGVADSDTEYIKPSNLTFVDVIFNGRLNYHTVTLESFTAQNTKKERFTPDMVFISNTNNEVILVFDEGRNIDVHSLELKMIQGKSEVDLPLDGFILLSPSSRHYIELTSTIERQYEAYLNNDVTFTASTLTLGPVSSFVSTDSTVAVNISNGTTLNPKCAILVFGNDLMLDGGSAMAPISGLTLISQSTGTIPVDDMVVKNFEQQKQKSFLGFVYLGDLETVDTTKVMYMNFQAPSGLSTGRYSGVLSTELQCPTAP